MDYELIFEKKQHHLTIPQIPRKKEYFGNISVEKAIKNQNSNHDLFITKYAHDGIVQCVILDFDDRDNPKNAYKDARKLFNFTKRKGLNTVIIQSGSKGYHCYIQIPPRAFGNMEHPSDVDVKLHFKKFVELLIGLDEGVSYPTLDSTNTNAGLRGNIRVINSIHPKTGKKCKIIEGEFKGLIEPNEFEWRCFESSRNWARVHSENKVRKHEAFVRKIKSKFGIDPVVSNDLRTLMPSIFGGDYKAFPKGYIMMQCPFHDDRNPSMVVTKEYYYCKSCEAKGNWWNLRELRYCDFEKEELIRVGEIND